MRPRRPEARSARRDRGQATIELVAYMPYIMLMFLVFVEAFAYFMTMEEVDSAARAGARIASQGGDGHGAARGALPERLHEKTTRITVTTYDGDAHATVKAQVPVIFDFDQIHWTVTRNVVMPLG